MLNYDEYHALCEALKMHLKGLYSRVHVEAVDEEQFKQRMTSLPGHEHKFLKESFIIHFSDPIASSLIASAFPGAEHRENRIFPQQSAIVFDCLNTDKLAVENISQFHAEIANETFKAVLNKSGRYGTCLNTISAQQNISADELHKTVTEIMLDTYMKPFAAAKTIEQRNQILLSMFSMYMTVRDPNGLNEFYLATILLSPTIK